MKKRKISQRKRMTISLINSGYDPHNRVSSIIAEQRFLAEEFVKTGDNKLISKFKELATEFQQIHRRHKTEISN